MISENLHTSTQQQQMMEQESQDHAYQEQPSMTSTDELAKNEKSFHELSEFDHTKLQIGNKSTGSIPTIPVTRIMKGTDSMLSLCKPYKVRCPLSLMYDVWSPSYNDALDAKERKKFPPKKMTFGYNPQYHDIFNSIYNTCQKVLENALAMNPGMEANTDINNPVNFDNMDVIEKSMSMKLKEVNGEFAPDFYEVVKNKDGSKKIKPVSRCPQIFSRGTIFYITFIPERLHVTRNSDTNRDILGMTLMIDSIIMDGARFVPARRIYTDTELDDELALISTPPSKKKRDRSSSPPETPKKKRQKRYRSESEDEASD